MIGDKNSYKLTIVNSSTDKKFDVYLQDSSLSRPTEHNSRSVPPSSSVILACENPTGNLFITVNGDEKWKGMVPAGVVLYYTPENNTVSDGSGEIPPVFVPFSQEKETNALLPQSTSSIFSSKKWIIIGIIILIIFIIILVYRYQKPRV